MKKNKYESRCAMKVERKRYVYVVVGLNDNSANFEGCFLIVSEPHAGYSTKEKAQQELGAIYREAVEELANEGETLTGWEMDSDSLSMDFPSGSHEYYRIYKILVN
jgi:hypothetical protein